MSIKPTPIDEAGSTRLIGKAEEGALPKPPPFRVTEIASKKPSTVYKYTSGTFAQRMLLEGRIRVGSLNQYRRSEHALRGDKHEGSQIQVSGVGHASGPELPQHQRRIAQDVGLPLGPTILFHQSSFEETQFDPDCYVYCTSFEFSAEAANDYDACVEISHPSEFARLIRPHLESAHGHSLFHESDYVVYANRRVEYPGRIARDLAFVKPADPFLVEQEFRFVWRGHPEPTSEFLDLKVPEIVPLLRLRQIPPRRNE